MRNEKIIRIFGSAVRWQHELRTGPAGVEPNPRRHKSVRRSRLLSYRGQDPGTNWQGRPPCRQVAASNATKAYDVVVRLM